MVLLCGYPLSTLARYLKRSAFGAFALSAMLAVGAAGFLYYDEPPSQAHASTSVEKAQQPSLERICFAAFPSHSVKNAMPFIADTFLVYQRPPRPDRKQTAIFFAFANEPLYKVPIGEGVHVFFKNNQWHLSKQPTPVFLYVEESRVQLIFSVGGSYEKQSAPLSSLPNIKTKPSAQFAHLLEEVERLDAFPPDLFFAQFGGRKLQHKGAFYRLGNGFSRVFFARSGDTFTLNKGMLVPIEKPKNARCPILRVRSVSRSKMDVEVWDSLDQEYGVVSLTPKAPKSLTFKPEELFRTIRLRRSDKVLVKMGKKTKLLTRGDYLFCSRGEWKVIDNEEELYNLIHYIDHGKLFVFEGIAKKEGKTLFCGTIYDETRSVSQKVTLPITTQQRQKSTSSKKYEEALDGDYDDLPPELEELLEELDDL